MVKAARRAGWGVVEGVQKTVPKGAVFCHLFTGTETYAVHASVQRSCDHFVRHRTFAP
jgi:hypothetical protein